MGLELLGTRVGSCLQRVPSPSSSLRPFLQAGHSPSSVTWRQLPFSAGLSLGQGHAGVCTHMQGWSAFPRAGCSQVPWWPRYTCAGYCLRGSRGRWHQAGAGLGWVQTDPVLAHLQGLGFILREVGRLRIHAPACPPPLPTPHPRGQQREFTWDWGCDFRDRGGQCG